HLLFHFLIHANILEEKSGRFKKKYLVNVFYPLISIEAEVILCGRQPRLTHLRLQKLGVSRLNRVSPTCTSLHLLGFTI
ncbi:hypothetical protein NDU88_002054, partial [Pleurodeles waltl]